jgi:predicted secreted protein
MTRLLWTAGLLLLTVPALAQAMPADKPLRLTVRPSGTEPEANEALERQQKLLMRLERSNHMVRSICIDCGDEWKHQIYAPFDPYAALGRAAQPSDSAGN